MPGPQQTSPVPTGQPTGQPAGQPTGHQGPTRTIVVVRHAQAESAAPSDAERALTAGGHDDAVELGAWLAGQDVAPDAALVSAATRTQQTWAALVEGAGWALADDAVSVDPALYAAGEDAALDLVRGVDDAVATLVVVGHNPTVAVLAQLLDDGEADPEVATAVLGGFAPATAAVFETTGAWADLGPGRATVRAFHVGRG